MKTKKQWNFLFFSSFSDFFFFVSKIKILRCRQWWLPSSTFNVTKFWQSYCSHSFRFIFYFCLALSFRRLLCGYVMNVLVPISLFFLICFALFSFAYFWILFLKEKIVFFYFFYFSNSIKWILFENGIFLFNPFELIASDDEL